MKYEKAASAKPRKAPLQVGYDGLVLGGAQGGAWSRRELPRGPPPAVTGGGQRREEGYDGAGTSWR